MSRTKLLLDLLEDVQAMSDSLRAVIQALATDDNPESTASPPKKSKAPSKKEVASEPVVKETPEQSQTQEPVEDEVAPEPSPSQEKVALEPEPHVKAITFEELRGAMAAKSQKGKKAELKALLSKYGVEKLSDIPVESYPEVMAEVEAL